jgi:hypothetical protein
MTARTNDEGGYVAVVSIVLILAIMVGAYARAITSDVPRWGAESERAWEAQIVSSMGEVASATASFTGSGAKVSIPPMPLARALDVPLIGQTAPAPASGAVAFDGDCASFSASHTSADGTQTTDIVDAAPGCIAFHGAMAYSPSFSYVVEFGGLVRVQSEGAVVLHGLPLDVTIEDGLHRVTLGVASLAGAPTSISAEGTTTEVQVTPTSLSPERASRPNAAEVEWELETTNAAAWKLWFENELRDEGLTPGDHFSVTCAPISCASSPSDPALVKVSLSGPGSGDDVAVAIAHGSYAVQLS